MESSSGSPRIKYDVFISFRGDIRTSFLSHLTKELRRNQIDFFIDDEKLHPGDEISSTLLQAIEESSISLVIFSKHYASSRWCMEELVKIIECMKQYERIVIPVFYNIDPSDVRHQKRTFAEAFDVHKERYEKESMQNWRSILKEAANLSGIHYPSKYRELIELPHNIKTLSSLRTLEVRGCCGLRSIPELPPSIQVFRADGCTSLERIFSLKAVFSLNMRKISFVNCMRLEEESVNDIMEDAHLTIFRNVLLWSEDPNLMNCNHYLETDGLVCYPNYLDVKGSVYYPGYKVPEWFRCQTEEASSITVELDQPYYRLLGFFFCCVVSHKLPPHYFEERDGGVNIKCEYRHLGHGVKHTFVCERLYFIGERRCKSDHVLIWNDPICNADILSKTGFIRGCYGSDDDDSTCNEKMSFRFSVDRPENGKRVEEREEDDEDCFIKGCGVFPVYASTVLDVIHELELELKLNPHYDATTGMDLEALKSAMIRMIRAKSIILLGYDSSSDSEEESCSDQEEEW
ncbi:hypothetical protein PIB30_014948 [Stylosanthes scabra]|uniref:TIR domain-containing protein n=1 Tax=Stylosanthes scabra TaxID=79078 RepID=A0ABU6W6R9_9FABA|nr:hypothetical protein [Stylosanthes scabra]